MKISVTQHHIDTGVRGSCSRDPIALAMKDAGAEKVWASPTYLSWWKDLKVYNVPTPEAVWRFMKLFDNKVPVEPFEFEVGE